MSSTPIVDDMMTAYAADGVDYVARVFDFKLDYSEASVEHVEAILNTLFEARPKGFFEKLVRTGPTPEEIDLVTKMLGGYVGEVMKRNWGGRWKLESRAFPGKKVITFELASGGYVWPPFKVGKRITNGPEDNVWHYYQALREKHAGLAGT